MTIDLPTVETAPWLREAQRLSALGLTSSEIEGVLAKRGFSDVAIVFALAVVRSDEVRARYVRAYQGCIGDAQEQVQWGQLRPGVWRGSEGPRAPRAPSPDVRPLSAAG